MKATVSREKLIVILQENADSHRAIFEEAVEGYRSKALEELQGRIEAIKSNHNKPVQVYVHLTAPEDHTRDYEDVIELIGMSEQPTIELNEVDFKQYVKDDWGWKKQWLGSNKMYSQTAASLAVDFE